MKSFSKDISLGAPIMPGVLQIEAMAQAAAILAIETLELAGSGKLVYFMAIEEAKFRTPVEPGCLLDLHVGFVQKRARVCKFWGRAEVDGKITSEVKFTAMVADPPADAELGRTLRLQLARRLRGAPF